MTVDFAAPSAGEGNLASMKLRQKRSLNLGEISRRLAWLAGTEPVTEFQVPKDVLQLKRTHDVFLGLHLFIGLPQCLEVKSQVV